MVSMVAFQAVHPGSIPGHRILIIFYQNIKSLIDNPCWLLLRSFTEIMENRYRFSFHIGVSF